MSDLYESIPPEQEIGYLQHAQEVIDTAAEPAIKDLGESAVKDAVELTTLDATSSTIGEEADQIVRNNDLSQVFIKEMEKPRESDIAERAQLYADTHAAFTLSKEKRASMKHLDLKIDNLEKPQASEPPEQDVN